MVVNFDTATTLLAVDASGALVGGSILPGKLNGKDVVVQDVFEAVGKHAAGTMSDAELAILERELARLGGTPVPDDDGDDS